MDERGEVSLRTSKREARMGARWFRRRRHNADHGQVVLPSKNKTKAGSSVDLPDLEDASAGDIQRTNVKASDALYFSALLEKTRLTPVTDKLVQLFEAGVRPLGKRKRRRDDG